MPDFGAVIARYEQEEMPERYSTRAAYESLINNHIRPRWADDVPEHGEAYGCGGLAEEFEIGSKDQEPCPEPYAHDFSVCGAVGVDGEEPDQTSFG